MYFTANYTAGHKRIMGYAASDYSVNSFYHRVLDISSCDDTALEDIDRCANCRILLWQLAIATSQRQEHHRGTHITASHDCIADDDLALDANIIQPPTN